jgi:hypothetical protein
MIDRKDAIGRGPKIPQICLKLGMACLVKIFQQIRFAIEPFARRSSDACGFKSLA